MYKKTILLCCLYLLSWHIYAQGEEKEVLQQIAENNQELKALLIAQERQQFLLNAENTLPDPELGAYYLPFAQHIGGSYTEVQLTQTFEFPTVYAKRKRVANEQKALWRLRYQQKKQAVLLEAKMHLQELTMLNKRQSIVEKRLADAKRVYEQTQALFDKGEVTALTLNKAKVIWMQLGFAMEDVVLVQKNTYKQLQLLNGGNTVQWTKADFEEGALVELEMKEVWQEKRLADPYWQVLKQQQQLAEQQMEMAKQQRLPNLTIGANYQGDGSNNYAGIYGGISIPLWNKGQRLKAAQQNLKLQNFKGTLGEQEKYVAFLEEWNTYHLLLEKYKNYQNTLLTLNSDALLSKAYELGEITFTEYYMELAFYRTAYDKMLEMELELHHLQSNLLKHQL